LTSHAARAGERVSKLSARCRRFLAAPPMIVRARRPTLQGMSHQPNTAMRPFARLRTALAAALLVSACLHAGAARAPASDIWLLHASAAGYLVDDTTTPAGAYLAVTCDKGACALVPTQVTIANQDVQTREGTESLPVMHADLKTHPLFLVQGVPGLAAGPVRTWYVNERFLASDDPASMAPARRRLDRAVSVDGGDSVSFDGRWLQGQDPSCSGPGCGARQLAWKVRFGQTERTLATLWPDGIVGEDGMLGVDDVLIWVGDLDGDGKPDFVIRPQTRPDYLELSLFLSTRLQVGKPWRAAARFYYWDPRNAGC